MRAFCNHKLQLSDRDIQTITWRGRTDVALARRVIGCHLTQETRGGKCASLTWRAISGRPYDVAGGGGARGAPSGRRGVENKHSTDIEPTK